MEETAKIEKVGNEKEETKRVKRELVSLHTAATSHKQKQRHTASDYIQYILQLL